MNSTRKLRIAVVLMLFLAGAAAPCWGKTFYSIQVAASTDKAEAEATQDQMNRMGHHAFVRLETVPGKGEWHRVYVGKFGSKADADKEAAMLRSLGLLNECHVRALKEEPESKSNAPRSKVEPAPQSNSSQSPAKQGKAVSGGLHFLHVASYQKKENAEKEVVHLGKKGQKAFLVEETVAGKRWFRVYLGEFADAREAQGAGSRLKEKGVISYFKVIGFDKTGHVAAKKR